MNLQDYTDDWVHHTGGYSLHWYTTQQEKEWDYTKDQADFFCRLSVILLVTILKSLIRT